MEGKKEFQELLEKHLAISKMVAKHFLKIGKKETSACVKHKVIIIDGDARLKTMVSLLPHRRYYTNGGEKFSNPYEYYEIEEDIEL